VNDDAQQVQITFENNAFYFNKITRTCSKCKLLEENHHIKTIFYSDKQQWRYFGFIAVSAPFWHRSDPHWPQLCLLMNENFLFRPLHFLVFSQIQWNIAWNYTHSPTFWRQIHSVIVEWSSQIILHKTASPDCNNLDCSIVNVLQN
jgi:hypothetical protein